MVLYQPKKSGVPAGYYIEVGSNSNNKLDHVDFIKLFSISKAIFNWFIKFYKKKSITILFLIFHILFVL